VILFFLIENLINNKNKNKKVLEDNIETQQEISTHWKSSLNSKYIVKIKDIYECVSTKKSRKKYFLIVME
jgi:hypothetical protein